MDRHINMKKAFTAMSRMVSIPNWDTLNALGKSRILRSSYLWLILVPIAAKALGSVENPIVLTGLGKGLIVSLTLPFSWKLFYFSSVAISIAGLIYSLACPEIIRKFSTFGQYMSEGRGVTYLYDYMERSGIYRSAELEKLKENMRALPENKLAEVFWPTFNMENEKKTLLRFICLIFYLIGFLSVTVVMVQNFIFVVNLVRSTGFWTT